jgi:uncharacterized protein (DUF2141 family)
MNKYLAACATGIATLSLASPAPAAAQYQQKIGNDLSKCYKGSSSAVMVTIDGIKNSIGDVRVQTYRATSADWLKKGRWINRIEVPAKTGSMTFCVPVPGPGSYAIAVRHDANDNRDTDITVDGGAMSNNPSINIFNLGKPSVSKAAFAVGNGVKSIRIQMRYM